MAFDLNRLQTLIARHGHVARVVIADVQGSSPREVGAHIWVWQDGQSGTIGGGALEYQAVEQVRAALSRPASWSAVHPLGPQLGQCCGGVVRLVYEIFNQHS
ncbi:MAG: XdhC family protein, partial [Paracoccaceae bacterium]